MASKKEKLQARLQEILARESPALIDEAMAGRIQEELRPLSSRKLRDLLRETGLPLAPLVEGIRQDDFHHLERTLLEFAQEYAQAAEAGNHSRQRECRSAVKLAKDHAKLAAHNPKVDPAKRAVKEEMVLWMLTWLENPSVFELWVPMRKQALIETLPSPL